MNEMNKKIKNAFDSVHADENTINNTIKYINSKRVYRKPTFQKLIPVAASFIFFLVISLFGYKIYNTSTVVLSVDINPSFEISLNRFDKVISIQEFNEDGEKFVESLDLKNMNYKDALDLILEKEEFANTEISFTVAGKEGKQKNNISTNINTISKENQNIYCDSATEEEVCEAHTKGLSFGKYKAYLTLIENGYEITEEEIKDMPMKDIHERLKDKDSHGKHENSSNDGPDSNHDKGNNGKHDGESNKNDIKNDNEEDTFSKTEDNAFENDGKGNGQSGGNKVNGNFGANESTDVSNGEPNTDSGHKGNGNSGENAEINSSNGMPNTDLSGNNGNGSSNGQWGTNSSNSQGNGHMNGVRQ